MEWEEKSKRDQDREEAQRNKEELKSFDDEGITGTGAALREGNFKSFPKQRQEGVTLFESFCNYQKQEINTKLEGKGEGGGRGRGRCNVGSKMPKRIRERDLIVLFDFS